MHILPILEEATILKFFSSQALKYWIFFFYKNIICERSKNFRSKHINFSRTGFFGVPSRFALHSSNCTVNVLYKSRPGTWNEPEFTVEERKILFSIYVSEIIYIYICIRDYPWNFVKFSETIWILWKLIIVLDTSSNWIAIYLCNITVKPLIFHLISQNSQFEISKVCNIWLQRFRD